MLQHVDSPYLVPFDGSFRVADAPTAPPDDAPGKRAQRLRLENAVDALVDLQRRMYAEDRWSLLLIFQGLDAAGKDSTIRRVLAGVDPAGLEAYSFKQPSALELDHDFLWRTSLRLPQRGRIGVFNRSYYEEVLVVRVNPEYLGPQRLPEQAYDDLDALWAGRYESIRDHERHLARNGTAILKFWLNHSREVQRERFLARLDRPERHWKFSVDDVAKRAQWDDYQLAFEEALNATSRPWAPWYAVPADDKRYLRATVAQLVADALEQIAPRYPEVPEDRLQSFADARALLETEADEQPEEGEKDGKPKKGRDRKGGKSS